MLRYPRLTIPEERFAWIYTLAMELEPEAEIYWWEDHQRDIKDTWAARLEGKELQAYGDSAELQSLCLPLLKRYPRIHCFFSFLLDACLMQGRMEYAQYLVDRRKEWMIKHPYKVLGKEAFEIGWPDSLMRSPDGTDYKLSMGDWIGAMRTIQFYEIDVQHKIDTGFIFRARPRKK